MKKVFLFALMTMTSLMSWAGDVTDSDNRESDFQSDERLEEGFVTEALNREIERGFDSMDKAAEVRYGRKVTDFATAPKFGAYFIGKYDYTDREGAHSGNGFSQRLVRAYVDGKILGDFTYRVQVQVNNASFHMKDFFVEWGKFSEFKVKVGQYKRAFGFENPMNPWDVGVGDYSQLTKKLTGHSDFIGSEASSCGGRDQGIQVQGDLFPVGKDKHRLIHYQLMVANGQGINAADANSQKDVIGTLQVQPVKGLFLGFFGWTGNATYNNITVGRNRYMISAKYDANDWTFRAEYAHSTGHKISDYVPEKTHDGMAQVYTPAHFEGTGRADAWYATIGIPCTPWLKTYVKYDTYRDSGTWDSTRSIYSLCPNFQLHKNLMIQVQYNYVHDRTLTKKNSNELWVETYVRF